jgi:hypothetical protein
VIISDMTPRLVGKARPLVEEKSLVVCGIEFNPNTTKASIDRVKNKPKKLLLFLFDLRI